MVQNAKKKMCVLTMCICMVLSWGCGKNEGGTSSQNIQSEETMNMSEVQTSEVQEPAVQTFPDSYYYESDMLKINIDDVKTRKASFVKGTQRVSDTADLIGIAESFLPDDGNNVYSRTESGGVEIYSADGEEYATAGTYGCWYDSDVAGYYYSCIHDSIRDIGYNLDKYSEEKTFAFGSADDAREAICEYFKEYGIDFANDYDCQVFYLDHETLAEEENHESISGKDTSNLYKDSWTEDDDAYLFYFQQLYCDLPYYDTYASSNVDFENTQVSIIYNKDGIVKLYIWGLRDFSYSDESVTLLPFDDVVESLKTHFEGIMDDNTYEVVDAVLVSDSLESASDECEIIPVWAFYYYEYFPEYPDNPGKYTIRVNAETGQIVIHNIGVE